MLYEVITNLIADQADGNVGTGGDENHSQRHDHHGLQLGGDGKGGTDVV